MNLGEDILKALHQVYRGTNQRAAHQQRTNDFIAQMAALHRQHSPRPRSQHYADDPRKIIALGERGEPVYEITCVVIATEVNRL